MIRETPQSLSRPRILYRVVKRGGDIIGALLGLILFAPLMLLIALLIWRGIHRPVFYRRRVLACQAYQDSETLHTFDAFKFRTMVPDADTLLHNNTALQQEYEKEFKLRHDPRVTGMGKRLRRTSLDELPQLINVLRGEMSLVGPRMISPPELARYGEYAGKLLSVRPGLTGLWQVSGRTDVSYRERVRLDLWYIENRSLLLDLSILLRTVGSVLSRRGAF
jgi:lipopolysaccharide/colanic/teichoic acid biosynthesis glycosyltransferase